MSKTFCLMPWIHTHILPNGDVLPCCAVQVNTFSLGNVNEKKIEQIWNEEAYKNLRLDMLSGKTVDACKVCYLSERGGGTSMRTKTNDDFKHLSHLVSKTNKDGSLPDFHIYYYDVRFSNLCNLKCRMCGPDLSSAIATEQAKQNGTPMPKPVEVYNDKEDFLEHFRPHIPYIEQINFAGGEPLLIDGHYYALEELISQGRTDVHLRYSTNLNILKRGKWYAPEFWRKFSNVMVGASLDAMGERAEYIREGTNWKKVIENRTWIKKECPNADFRIFTTIGALNILHFPDFIRWAIDSKFITTEKFVTSNIVGPAYLSSQILPPALKKLAEKKYEELIDYLNEKNTPNWIIGNLKANIHYMNAADRTDLLRDFFRNTEIQDKVYKRNFYDVFPELKSLADHI